MILPIYADLTGCLDMHSAYLNGPYLSLVTFTIVNMVTSIQLTSLVLRVESRNRNFSKVKLFLRQKKSLLKLIANWVIFLYLFCSLRLSNSKQ